MRMAIGARATKGASSREASPKFSYSSAAGEAMALAKVFSWSSVTPRAPGAQVLQAQVPRPEDSSARRETGVVNSSSQPSKLAMRRPCGCCCSADEVPSISAVMIMIADQTMAKGKCCVGWVSIEDRDESGGSSGAIFNARYRSASWQVTIALRELP